MIEKKRCKGFGIFMLIVGIVLVMGISGSVLAVDYYIDYETGDDTNDGLITSTPWKHCPGDDNAVGNPAITNLQAGDTVYFKGGIQYNGRVDIDWSGSVGNEIIYDGNSAGSWGIGKAILDGEQIRSQGFNSPIARSYILIDNFEIRNLLVTAYYGTVGIYFSLSDHITIRNCYFWDIGYWDNDGSQYPNGYGIRFNQGNNNLVDNCEFTKCGKSAIQLYGTHDVLINNCDIHDYFNWGIDIAGEYAPTYNNTIRGCKIHDIWQYDCKYNTPCTVEEGCWRGSCTDPDNPHTDFIFIRRGSAGDPYDNIIEGNLFYNNKDFTNYSYDGTAMTYISGGDGNVVRNNIYINPHSMYTVELSENDEFYNNIVYNLQWRGVRFVENGGILKNNIIITQDYCLLFNNVTIASTLISDNNVFYTPFRIAVAGLPFTPYTTLFDWQNASGQDTNSQQVNSIADIKFNSLIGYPENCDAMDLHLQSSSPAIDAGTDLSAFFTIDFDGVTRPQGSAWDIGAYEYILSQTCSEKGGVDCCTVGETCSGTSYGTASDCSGICCSVICTTSSTCGPADTDFSGVVSILEVMAYITEWKAGSVGIVDLMAGITEWKSGCS